MSGAGTAPPAAGRARGAAAMGVLLACGLAIWGWRHRSGSVDMALHYALVEYIRESWAWPTLAVQHMGEMNQYPPVAHTVAALVGMLTGSPFLGLHLVATTAVIVAYAALFVLLRFATARETIVAAGALAVLLLILAPSHALIGREIVENYFYPQLCGTSCAFALVALRARLRLGIAGEIAAALAATFLMGWLYPIGAVQLAGTAVAWRALLVARAWHETRRVDIVALASVPLLALALVAAIVLNPRFPVVTALAVNEGWVSLRIPRLLVIPATLLLGAAASLLALGYMRGRLRLATPEAFVALCAGVTAASLAQEASYYGLGSGSRYGVFKHIFPVSTLLAAAAVVGAMHVLRRAGAGTPEAEARLATLARLAFVPATLVAILASDLPWRGERLAAAMRTEAYLRTVAREPGVAGHAVLLAGTLTDRFSFSMGLLRLPKALSYELIYRSESTLDRRRAIIERTPVTYAFVREDPARDTACRIRADEATRLAMIRLACDPRVVESN